jgi:hypothetical protein
MTVSRRRREGIERITTGFRINYYWFPDEKQYVIGQETVCVRPDYIRCSVRLYQVLRPIISGLQTVSLLLPKREYQVIKSKVSRL